ncbi:MAG TPA: DUF1788 domain-containing protein [Armatimonadota bacterium]|jgi:hypothetical protein|nr:DUF1788 domain-containing protein [Armatimonadota bacterium]HPP74124.1 DUF1788 domain-containing protein [Armatimonadota bacterium]
MLSLAERIELLENDLKSVPSRISVYHDLPFAIFRYEPKEEWELRRQLRLLSTRLLENGKAIEFISLADLLWEIIDTTEGLDAIVELENDRGYKAAQDQVTTYMSDRDWKPLVDVLVKHLEKLDTNKNVAFLTRAGAMAPGIYHMSKLLDELQGKTMVTTILFYPGALDGTTGLRFMDLKGREALGNYRVKIYG